MHLLSDHLQLLLKLAFPVCQLVEAMHKRSIVLLHLTVASLHFIQVILLDLQSAFLVGQKLRELLKPGSRASTLCVGLHCNVS